MLGLARVQPESDLEVEFARPCLTGQRFRRGERPPIACAAVSKTETVESPSPIDLRKRPPCASTACTIGSSWRTSAEAMTSGCCSQSAVEPSMSVRQKVTTPVGSDSPSRPAGARRIRPGSEVAGRIGCQPETDRLLEADGLFRVDAVPPGQHAGRHRPGQQCERRRREQLDVRGPQRRGRRRPARVHGTPASRRAAAASSALTTCRSARRLIHTSRARSRQNPATVCRSR